MIGVEPSKYVLSKEVQIDKELETLLDQVKNKYEENDIKDHENLIDKWLHENQKEFDEQVKKFKMEVTKARIFQKLDDLEKQEEILTFFDNQSRISKLYNHKAFASENLQDIPIEPEETQFKVRAEKHFKRWPKYANRPTISLRETREKKEIHDSLSKIYLDNQNAQTIQDTKVSSRR